MNILLIHQNFPGQFRNLAPELARAGHRLLALSMRPEPRIGTIDNRGYRVQRGNTPGQHPWLVSTESAVLRGQQVAREVQQLLAQGFVPDLVLGHTGWGEMLCLREILPRSRLIGLNEMHYLAQGADVGFDPEFPADPDVAARLAVRNMHLSASLLACDVAITPTHWQAGTFPARLRQHMQVLHEGIRTDLLRPNPQASVQIGSLQLRAGDEVVTFINRNLEPMRGYHQFMRALPAILRARPRARAVIVGGDDVSYGPRPPQGSKWKDIYLQQVRDQLDLSRVHFVGKVPYAALTELLRVSAAHVYLTVPFVLSWSILEAMSLGALVIGSDTAPVREVIEHQHNGLLVDFFQPRQLADAVVDALARPEAYRSLRQQARQTIVTRYDFQTRSLPAFLRLIASFPA